MRSFVSYVLTYIAAVLLSLVSCLYHHRIFGVLSVTKSFQVLIPSPVPDKAELTGLPENWSALESLDELLLIVADVNWC